MRFLLIAAFLVAKTLAHRDYGSEAPSENQVRQLSRTRRATRLFLLLPFLLYDGTTKTAREHGVHPRDTHASGRTPS
jgi:hypothetical protein